MPYISLPWLCICIARFFCKLTDMQSLHGTVVDVTHYVYIVLEIIHFFSQKIQGKIIWLLDHPPLEISLFICGGETGISNSHLQYFYGSTTQGYSTHTIVASACTTGGPDNWRLPEMFRDLHLHYFEINELWLRCSFFVIWRPVQQIYTDPHNEPFESTKYTLKPAQTRAAEIPEPMTENKR